MPNPPETGKPPYCSAQRSRAQVSYAYLFGPRDRPEALPWSSWRERGEELIDRVRQIEHAEPEHHRDQKGIDLAGDQVDSPAG